MEKYIEVAKELTAREIRAGITATTQKVLNPEWMEPLDKIGGAMVRNGAQRGQLYVTDLESGVKYDLELKKFVSGGRAQDRINSEYRKSLEV